MNPIYSVTTNRTYQIKGDVKDFGVKIVNQRNRTIEEENCVNGTFFWYADAARTQTYPTSILVMDEKILRNEANHYPEFHTPQSVFIVYNDNRVEMKKVSFASQLDCKNIRVAIGGVGLRDITNPNFMYDPWGEGFRKGRRLQDGLTVDYSDVLRKTNKTVVGYNKKENSIYLMCRPNIYHQHATQYDLIKLVKDCGYDIAISLDGGGSTFMNNSKDMVLYGDNRRVHNIVGFNL